MSKKRLIKNNACEDCIYFKYNSISKCVDILYYDDKIDENLPDGYCDHFIYDDLDINEKPRSKTDVCCENAEFEYTEED